MTATMLAPAATRNVDPVDKGQHGDDDQATTIPPRAPSAPARMLTRSSEDASNGLSDIGQAPRSAAFRCRAWAVDAARLRCLGAGHEVRPHEWVRMDEPVHPRWRAYVIGGNLIVSASGWHDPSCQVGGI